MVLWGEAWVAELARWLALGAGGLLPSQPRRRLWAAPALEQEWVEEHYWAAGPLVRLWVREGQS